MTLNFSIEYRTEWGQSVEVELCFLSAEGKAHHERIPLDTEDGYTWKKHCALKAYAKRMTYTYLITEGSNVCRREWEGVPRLFPADDARTYFFIDHWRDVSASSYCYTDAYMAATGRSQHPLPAIALFPRTYLFRVQAPQLAEGERVALVGDQPALGDWDTRRALPMIPSSRHEWVLSISADGLRLPFQYKYIIVGSKRLSQHPNANGAQEAKMGHEAMAQNREPWSVADEVKWEEGPNRESPLPSLSNSKAPANAPAWGRTTGGESLPSRGGLEGSGSMKGSVVALSDGEVRIKASHWKVAGVVVPLFSLRTEGSQGVGDFADLKEMVDWVAQTGMHAVQLLPIYDTTQTRSELDSYPYNAISVHALHPIYADLRQLPLADEAKLVSFQERWHELNALPALDYVEVLRLKEAYLHSLYEEQRRSITQKPAFRTFLHENAEWLQPYCAYCLLRDTYGTASFSAWPKLSTYNRSSVASYAKRHAGEVGYYAFVQYILHQQLSDAADYARSQKVFLKGDLPIGISPSSVEAWQEPHLFHMDMSAGAPPDDFSRTGQNWGFPTYDWERMAADGYLWWRQRLGGMSRYFSAYRIDHILGFFRIWQIPKGSPTALLGQFSPALPLTIGEIESYGMRFREELFVPHHPSTTGEKPTEPLYHPRIGVIGEEAWLSLPKYEQGAFIRLYEDFFFRRHNDFWAACALQKLPALIGASNMLVCGEDLGMVPACVGPVMQQLGILSLEIQAMPKEYGVPFAQLHNNPYRSVATIFTHDMPTLRLWWKENPERTNLYYNTILGRDGTAPEEPAGWLCEEIVAHHLNCPSMLCLISLQDWLSMDEGLRNPNPDEERINVPANPKHYWRYRMHLPISKLLEARDFNERLHTLIVRSGR